MKKIIIYISLIILTSCVNFDEDNTSSTSVDKFPLEVGNKWYYTVNEGTSISYKDSIFIQKIKYLNLPSGEFKQVYLMKDLLFNRYDPFINDYSQIRILNITDSKLINYGYELRDSLYLHEYANVLYNEPVTLVNYWNSFQNELFKNNRHKLVSSFNLVNIDDTAYNTIRVNHEYFDNEYYYNSSNGDFDIYYSDYGIIKINGSIRDNYIEAILDSCIIGGKKIHF